MPTCILCQQPAEEGLERCGRHQQIYRWGRRVEEERKAKSLFAIGFEFGAAFALGSTLMLIPLFIIVAIVAGVCALG